MSLKVYEIKTLVLIAFLCFSCSFLGEITSSGITESSDLSPFLLLMGIAKWLSGRTAPIQSSSVTNESDLNHSGINTLFSTSRFSSVGECDRFKTIFVFEKLVHINDFWTKYKQIKKQCSMEVLSFITLSYIYITDSTNSLDVYSQIVFSRKSLSL